MAQENIFGKIKCLKLNSFLVHDNFVVPVGMHLNIVVAPNGNGKSSLVAAIILGMGGEPKTVNDQKPLIHYIKNGANEASIEIDIFVNNNKDTVTFRRDLIKDGNACKSKYFINSDNTTKKIYLEEVAKFNIQINNLCQFIPQDRVQKFTQMNPQDLFKNTQKSVCSNELNEIYDNLSHIRIDNEKCEKESKEMTEILALEVRKNKEIQPSIENLSKKNKLKKELEIAEIKKLWFAYESQKDDLGKLENDLKRAFNTLKQKKNSMQPIKRNYDSFVQLKNTIDFELKKNIEKLRIINTEKTKINDAKEAKFTEYSNSIGNHKRSLLDNKETAKEIVNATLILNGIVQDLKIVAENINTAVNREQYQEMSNEIAVFGKEIEKLSHQREIIVRQIEIEFTPQIAACERRMHLMHNIQEKRELILRKKSEDSFKALMWLRSNRHLFKENIYEPMLLELNIKENSNAKYLESTINIRDLTAFTCENTDDMSLFTSKVRSELKLIVGVIHSKASDRVEYKSTHDIKILRKYGFESFLIDMVTGPIPILNALCRDYRIHQIPVGNDDTYHNFFKVPNEINCFFSTNHKFIIKTSRYTQEKSSMCSEIYSSNTLNIGIDVRLLQEQQNHKKQLIRKTDSLKNHKNEIEGEINKIEISRKEKIEVLREEESQRKKVYQLKQKIDRQNEKIKQLKRELSDPEEEKTKLINIANGCIKQLLLLSKDDIKKMEKMGNISIEIKKTKKKIENLSIQFVEIETEMAQAMEEVRTTENLVQTIEEARNSIQDKCKKYLDAVLEKTNGKNPINRETFPYTEEFDKLPKILNDLNEHIKMIQIKIDFMANSADANLMEQYEQRKIYIGKLCKDIKEKQLFLKNCTYNLKEMHNKWFPAVNTIVEDINIHFCKFFSTIKCIGQVRLIYNDIHDYASFGIEISVQFRPNTPIVPLKHFQSGGERTFSIALYTLALQHLSHVPFRCVDEINQGMDQMSERRVFSILVDEAAKEHTSQYFFVTPKLLPNLPYNDNVNYIIIFNSGNIESHVFDK